MNLSRVSLLLTLCLVFICLACFSQTNGKSVFYIYEDSAKTLTSQKALELFEQGKFKNVTTNNLNQGFTQSIFWLAYQNEKQIPNDSLLLYIGHHHINRIHYYFVNEAKIQLQYLTGDYYPFKQRPINATGFYFPIAKRGLYLAQIDKSNESLQMSFNLVSKLNAIATEANNKIIMAVFTGMILLMLIFGTYLFVISKDTIYILYILYICAGWLYVLANAGYGFEYLWPNLPWFASKSRPVFAIIPLIFSMLFLVKYIGGLQSKRIAKLVKIINIVLFTCVVIILLFNEKGYQNKLWMYIQYFIPLLSTSFAILILSILITASVKGNRLATFYLIAVVVLMISAILQSSFAFGGFNSISNLLSNYGLAFGFVIEVIILTAGLVYRFNQYRVDKEQILVKMNNQQQENTRIIMQVQEAERSQVANQLHDVAGSLLSAAKLNLSALSKSSIGNENSANFAQKAEEAVDLVADMVRNLSHALSPVMLEKVGFKTTLEKVAAIVNASGKINIQLLVLGFEKFEPGFNKYYTALYGMVYELLNNIVKHAQAKNVLVQATEHEHCFSLIIEDDGIGMPLLNLRTNTTLGLVGIQSKVHSLNGMVAFDKNVPQGLIVTIEIPFKEHEN